jgi:hypothetical protein
MQGLGRARAPNGTVVPRMSDLDTLRSTPTPRPAAMCRRYARRIDSIFGFVVYGLLWFFVACGMATAALFLGIWIVGPQPGPVGMTIVMVMWGSAFVGAWVLFWLWVRRRLGPATLLFRDGTIVDATVQKSRRLSMRGAPFTHATVVWRDATRERSAGVSIGGHPPELDEGRTVPIMYVPDYGYCAAFPIAGKLVPASLAAG